MSFTNSLLVSAFGFAIVFLVLITLSFVLRAQSYLINLFTKNKTKGDQ